MLEDKEPLAHSDFTYVLYYVTITFKIYFHFPTLLATTMKLLYCFPLFRRRPDGRETGQANGNLWGACEHTPDKETELSKCSALFS